MLPPLRIPDGDSPTCSGELTPVAGVMSSSSESSLETNLGLIHLMSSVATSISDGRDQEPYYPTEQEANAYYYGLRGRPTLVYRSDFVDQFDEPVERRLLPVFDHALNDVWQDDIAWKVVDIVDNLAVKFNTIDVIRLKVADDSNDKGRPIIWVGVPAIPPLAPKTAHSAAQSILALLSERGILDVAVHFRENAYVLLAESSSAESPLLAPPETFAEGADIISPLTPTLGLGISLAKVPNIEGTLGLFMTSSKQPEALWGISCSHVLMGTEIHNKNWFYNTSAPRVDLMHLGTDAHRRAIIAIDRKITILSVTLDHHTSNLQRLRAEQTPDLLRIIELEAAQTGAQLDLTYLRETLQYVREKWANEKSRIIGRVVLSPRIAYGIDRQPYAEDWGLVQLERSQLGTAFEGNVINLATGVKPAEFQVRCSVRDHLGWTLVYPARGLLRLRGEIPDAEMINPSTFDTSLPEGDTNRCLLVVMKGNVSGVTLGWAKGIKSVTRTGSNETALAWVIHAYSEKEEFSKQGDSGAIVADLRGRIGGMLMSGSKTKRGVVDLSYAVPFHWLKNRVITHCEKSGLGKMTLEVD